MSQIEERIEERIEEFVKGSMIVALVAGLMFFSTVASGQEPGGNGGAAGGGSCVKCYHPAEPVHCATVTETQPVKCEPVPGEVQLCELRPGVDPGTGLVEYKFVCPTAREISFPDNPYLGRVRETNPGETGSDCYVRSTKYCFRAVDCSCKFHFRELDGTVFYKCAALDGDGDGMDARLQDQPDGVVCAGGPGATGDPIPVPTGQ